MARNDRNDGNGFADGKVKGAADEGRKKCAEMEDRWEMKYIRTPEARSGGCDLSRHSAVPHRAGGEGWVGRTTP